ncbi:MAG: 50S ribosomal protein L6 [Candidatus Caldarchaeum sp.]|nr:50S ribosomal protein L6 [Candidatus Caldarchaeum sp.]
MFTKYVEDSVSIPSDASVRIEGKKLVFEGKKGRVVKDVSHVPAEIRVEGERIVFRVPGKSRKSKALLGTLVSIAKNALTGVSKGYVYRMKVVSSHFPITVKVVGKEVHITNFIGERYVRKAKIVGDVSVQVKGDEIIISGVDRESVGQTAANIENATTIPRKDPRKFLDGIYVAEKAIGG